MIAASSRRKPPPGGSPTSASVADPEHGQAPGAKWGICGTGSGGFCKRATPAHVGDKKRATPARAGGWLGSAATAVGGHSYEPLPMEAREEDSDDGGYEEYVGKGAAERDMAEVSILPGARCRSFCISFWVTTLFAGGFGFGIGKFVSIKQGHANASLLASTTGHDATLVQPGDEKGSFDCETGYFGWRLAWTEEKQEWCCSHAGRGCSEGANSSSNLAGENSSSDNVSEFDGDALGPSPQADEPSLFNCDEQLEDWEVSWSDGKKSWCCVNEQRGCPWSARTANSTTEVAAGEAAGDVGGDVGTGQQPGIEAPRNPASCQLRPACAHLDGACCPTVNGVNLPCCTEEGTSEAPSGDAAGSSPDATTTTTWVPETTVSSRPSTTTSTTTAPSDGAPRRVPDSAAPLGCGTVCKTGGIDATCRGRVLYEANHRFAGSGDKCNLAHARVKEMCPACFACELAEVGC